MLKKATYVFTLVAFVIGIVPALASAGGKEIFLDKKCTKCHSIKNEGIEKDVSKSGKKKKGPDLSGVGLAGYDDAMLKDFLQKKGKKPSVYKDKEVKHKKKWKGSDEDLNALVAYLQSQKTKVDVEDDGDEDDDE